MKKKPNQTEKLIPTKGNKTIDKYSNAEKLLKEKELADLKKCGEEIKQILEKYGCTFLIKGAFEGNYLQANQMLIKLQNK